MPRRAGQGCRPRPPSFDRTRQGQVRVLLKKIRVVIIGRFYWRWFSVVAIAGTGIVIRDFMPHWWSKQRILLWVGFSGEKHFWWGNFGIW
jgi:hypothetical protein